MARTESDDGVTREFRRLTLLEMLRLHWNHLTMLPGKFRQLKTLRTLRLDGNQRTALPARFGQLTAPQSLWLGRTQMTALPPMVLASGAYSAVPRRIKASPYLPSRR